MKQKKIIAVLISLFVLPGLGQVYLGRKIWGYGIALTVVLLVLFLIILFEFDLYQQIQALSDTKYFLSHPSEFTRAAWVSKKSYYVGGIWTLVFIWFYALVDVIWPRKNNT